MRHPRRTERQLSIAEAIKITRKLERPNFVTPACWRGIQAVLVAICRHLPDPWPSQSTGKASLMKTTGYSRRSIQRYLYAACDLGLLEMRRVRHQGRWAQSVYTLPYLENRPLTVRQDDARTVRQDDALSSSVLRTPPPPSVKKREPPSAAGSPPRTLSDPKNLEEHPTQEEIDLMPWWMFRPPVDPSEEWPVYDHPDEYLNGRRLNLHPGKCAVCGGKVLPRMGFLNDQGKPCHAHGSPNMQYLCRMYEGHREEYGLRPHTAADIRVNNARFIPRDRRQS